MSVFVGAVCVHVSGCMNVHIRARVCVGACVFGVYACEFVACVCACVCLCTCVHDGVCICVFCVCVYVCESLSTALTSMVSRAGCGKPPQRTYISTINVATYQRLTTKLCISVTSHVHVLHVHVLQAYLQKFDFYSTRKKQ